MIIIASHMGKYMILIYICVRVHANASFAHIYSVASIHLLYLYSTVCLRKILNDTCFFNNNKMVAPTSDTGVVLLFPQNSLCLL